MVLRGFVTESMVANITELERTELPTDKHGIGSHTYVGFHPSKAKPTEVRSNHIQLHTLTTSHELCHTPLTRTEGVQSNHIFDQVLYEHRTKSSPLPGVQPPNPVIVKRGCVCVGGGGGKSTAPSPALPMGYGSDPSTSKHPM
jgi:hypothetical protein